MRTYYHTILDRLQFSPEADAFLRSAGKRVFDRSPTLMPQAVASYYSGNFDHEPVLAQLEAEQQALDVPIDTLRFILIACATERMHEAYVERGYTEEMFVDFLKDLRCKVYTHHTLSKVYGLPVSSVSYWYPLFLGLKLFALGRLQYEIYQRPDITEPVVVGGHTVQPDDIVRFIHIPAIGPLTREARMASYRKAYEFFKNDLGDKPFVLYCTSWLLYERNREFMSPTSNIVDFMNDFKIVKSFPVPSINYACIFDMPYKSGDPAVPKDNALRRSLAAWLDAGGVPGGGDGYFLFDGETIIND